MLRSMFLTLKFIKVLVVVTALLLSITLFISTKHLSKIPSRIILENFHIPLEPLLLWSSDFHISPIADIKNTLLTHHIQVIDKSLSYSCHLTNTCQIDLKVINQYNGIDLSPCPNRLKQRFYHIYYQNNEFLSMDMILCTHATSMCELFMPFNKPLIIIASTRYEIGRHTATRWMEWNHNLIRIAQYPWNTIAANNYYDLDVVYLPNLGYSPGITDDVTYHPTRFEILLSPARGINHQILLKLYTFLGKYHQIIFNQESHSSILKHNKRRKNLVSQSHQLGEISTNNNSFLQYSSYLRPNSLKSSPFESIYMEMKKKLTFSMIRDLYPTFHYTDLIQHPAIVILPYQVSYMSFFEYYRMGIPMFVPSINLLIRWQLKYRILNEKSWSSVYGNLDNSHSVINKHNHSHSQMKYDPNNDISYEALNEWLPLADYYTYPYIQLFDSWSHLFRMLHTVDLYNISQSMLHYHQQLQRETHLKWEMIINKVRQRKKDQLQESNRNSNQLYTCPVSYNNGHTYDTDDDDAYGNIENDDKDMKYLENTEKHRDDNIQNDVHISTIVRNIGTENISSTTTTTTASDVIVTNLGSVTNKSIQSYLPCTINDALYITYHIKLLLNECIGVIN